MEPPAKHDSQLPVVCVQPGPEDSLSGISWERVTHEVVGYLNGLWGVFLIIYSMLYIT